MPNVLDLRDPKKQTTAVKPDDRPVAKPVVPVNATNVTKPAPAVAAAPVPVEGSIGFRKWVLLLVLSLALAIIIIDTTLLNVSLRPIIVDLHTDIKGLQWVISAYALTLAALTITGGRLGDLFGRKRMFMAGAVIFAIGSFIASISTHLGVLVAGESIIEGIGAALMMPATASLLIANFHGRDRAVAFGVWGSIAGASSAIGPILGGYLTTHYSWRWGFRINVVVAAVLVIGSLLVIRESRDTHEKPQLDIVGTLLSAAGMLAVIFGVIQSSTFGWLKAKAPYALFGHTLSSTISVSALSIDLGILLLIAFALWEKLRERRGKTPLVSMGIFRIRQFTAGALTMTALSMGMTGLIFVLPVFLQGVLHLDALHTGLALLPMSVAILVMGPLSGFMATKFPPKRMIQVGIFINLVAVIVMYKLLGTDVTAARLAPGLILYGIGLGMVMAQVSNLTLSAVSVQQAGEASGLNNTLRQVGSSLGSALLGAVLLSAITANVSSGIMASSILPAQLKPQLESTIGANASNAAFGGSDGEAAGSVLPEAVTTEIKQVVNHATTDATKKTLLYGLPFTVLALLLSMLLPGSKNVETEQSATSAAGH